MRYINVFRICPFLSTIHSRLSRIAVLLISMLQTTNSHADSKLTFICKSSIRKVGDGNVIDETSIVNNINTRFFLPKARLAFARLRQTLNLALVFQDFDLKYYIWIKINTLGNAIDEIINQLTLNSSD